MDGRRTAGVFAVGLLVLLCTGLCAGLLPEDRMWFNALRAVLLSLPRFLMLPVVVGAIWLIRRGFRAGWVMLPLALVGVGLPPLPDLREDGVMVISANVQAYADEAESVELALAERRADVVLTVEQRVRKVEGMRRVAHNYDRDLPRPSHGAAMFCRDGLFCKGWISEQEYGTPGCGMPIGVLRVEADLCLVSIHVPPPVPICSEGMRPYVEEVASHIDDGRLVGDWGPCIAGDPVIVAGDLNYVPNSRVWRTLTDQGLDDAATWQGVWANSWPAGGGWPWAPFFRLDHVLVGDAKVSGLRYFGLPGADHRAVRFRVRVR